MSKLCDQCKSIGLPILLARYSVVPSSVPGQLPQWTSGDKVKDIALSNDFKYVLRSLRSGFLYLFYGKGPRGKNYWECYSIYADGSMVLQTDTTSAQPAASDAPVCTRDGHTNQNLYFLVIEHPEQCGKVWMAFSEHKWSTETCKRYKDDTKARDVRMQTIQPPAMATGQKHSHGELASLQSIHEVMEFDPQHINSARGTLPSTGPTGILSNEDGSYSATTLKAMSTRYVWAIAKDDNLPKQMLSKMVARGKSAGNKDGSAKPHVLALWDAVGIVHELNGFRNEAAGRIQQYGNERELQITAMNAIDGVKQALQNRARDQIRDRRKSFVMDWTAADTAERMKNVRESNDAKFIARNQDLCRRWEQDALKGADKNLAQQRQFGVMSSMTDVEWNAKQLQIDKQIDEDLKKYKQEKDADGKTADDRWKAVEDHKAAGAWPKYEGKLQVGAQTKFEQKYGIFLDNADKIIDARTVDLISWLEAPLFVDSLEDFHDQNLSDGIAFEDLIGDAIFGIASSKTGAELIEKWIIEAKASIKTNLVWRAIALNQKEGIVEIDAALSQAIGNTTVLKHDSWANIGASIKWNKLADLYKKALSLNNANLKVGVNSINTRGLDKVFLSIGDLIFKPFSGVIDTVGEKIIQSLLLIRAGTTHTAALALVEAQARYEGVSRARLIQRLNTANAFVADAVSSERAALNKAYSGLRADASAPSAKGFNAAMEIRLGLVVAVLESVNLWKLSQSVKTDAKVKWQIRAAMMATTAASIDIAASGIKGLSKVSDAAISFQVLKVSGGVLSAGASFIGGFLDWEVTKHNWGRKRYGTAIVYSMRSLGQFVGGSLTLLTALSYAAPLLEKLSIRFATRLSIQVATRAAFWALGARAALMLAGIWVSVGVLVISVAIWYFSDDALQEWCEDCAFGKLPQGSRFATPKLQMDALDKALVEIL